MPDITAGGQKLHYYAHRDGADRPPLVLVHGAGGSYMHWPAELRRLAGSTVYSLDLPGHGGSPGPGRDTISGYAEVVREFAAALDLPPFVLAGHSMGGAIAQEFALTYPDRLAGIILVGSGARLRVAQQILDGILVDPEATAVMVAQWSYAGEADPAALDLYVRRLRDVDPRVTHGDFLACNRFDRMADSARISLPTLVLCGEQDRMTPCKYSQYLADQIPGARLALIGGAGHMVMLEKPLEVTRKVARFMSPLPSFSTPPPPPAPRARDG